MKKYFGGMVALIIAEGMNAFCIPKQMKQDSRKFEYVLSTYSSSQISNVNNWINNNSASCTVTPNQQKACTIIVDEFYYHFSDGDFILNDHIYSLDQNRESGDLEMIIEPQYTTTIGGVDFYNVKPSNVLGSYTTAIQTTNKTF